MALKKEDLRSNSELAHVRPIELVTENGFSIVRSWEITGAAAPVGDPYLFSVRNPDGYEIQINVEIDRSVITEVLLRSRGQIDGTNSFWISCAERHLCDYLWERDDYPPGANLKVTRLTPDDCDLAIRWKSR